MAGGQAHHTSMVSTLAYWSARRGNGSGKPPFHGGAGGGTGRGEVEGGEGSEAPMLNSQLVLLEGGDEQQEGTTQAAGESATPEALRDAVERCVDEACKREEEGRNERARLSKELEKVKVDAVAEVRRLRALFEAMGAGGDRTATLTDFTLPPGASILDGSFSASLSAASGPPSSSSSSSNAFPTSIIELAALDMPNTTTTTTTAVRSGSSTTFAPPPPLGGGAEGDTVALLRQQVLDGEFRMRELRVALAAMEARCHALEEEFNGGGEGGLNQ